MKRFGFLNFSFFALLLFGGVLFASIACREADKTTLALPSTSTPIVSIIDSTPVPNPTTPILQVTPPVEVKCPGMTSLEMSFCAREDAYKSARELDQIVDEIASDLINHNNEASEWELESQRLFVLSHNSWEESKQLLCDWLSHRFEGGSMKPIVYWSCIDRENKNRIQDLDYFCSWDQRIVICQEAK